jgi:NTP pyrophosphatase (non-canonical NTP hydrolase)
VPWASDRTGDGRHDVADFRPVIANGESSTDDHGRYGRDMDLRELQDVIDRTYGERDRDRGVAPTVAWLAEEFGELAQAVRKGTPAEIAHEFSDVLAWVATLANQVGVDLTEVVDRYRDGCPKCTSIPCSC